MSNISNFLKPDRAKMWIFIAIIIGFYFVFFMDPYDNTLNSFIFYPISFVQYFGFEIEHGSLITIVIVVLSIYWYLLSCILFELISKFKKI